MQERMLRQAAAIGGIVFVVLVVITTVLVIGAPTPDKSTAKIVKWYADHRGAIFTSGALTGLMMIAFLVFIGYLYHALSRQGGARAVLGAILLAGSVATDTIAAVAVLPGLALAVAANRPGVPPSEALVHTLEDLAYFPGALISIGVGMFLVIAGLLIADGALAPSWAKWVAYVGAVLSIVGGFVSAYVSKSGKPNVGGLVGLIGTGVFGIVVLAISISLLGDGAPAPA